MMFEISGLDVAIRELEEATAAMEAVDGELVDVSFNTEDQDSIDAAIHVMELAVDRKLSRWQHNDLVQELAASIKEEMRASILEEASRPDEG